VDVGSPIAPGWGVFGQASFAARLRRQRERLQLSLDDIARVTRIRRDLLEGLEAGDLSAWPNGLYARAWVRGYAEAVGLDGDEMVDEFCRLFPHGDRRVRETMQNLASILDVPPGFLDDQAVHEQTYGRRISDRERPLPPPSLRDRMGQAARIVTEARGMRDLPGRLAASWRVLRPSRDSF